MRKMTRLGFYPPIDAYADGMLDVGDGHQIYFEQSGNPEGRPVIFLHGGPGGGCQPIHRQQFDPKHYRIIIMDQRGCGRSLPYACLDDNTTWHLVADIERLRAHLKIDQWIVFGGSWGSTLSLAYAQSHPEAVLGLVLRGIFLMRRHELLWMYQEGASHLYPEEYDRYVSVIPSHEQGDLMSAFYRRLTGSNAEEALRAARAWSRWEGALLSIAPNEARAQEFSSDEFAKAFARIECHYFVHGGWMRDDGQLLKDVGRVRHIPAYIIHGRHDVVTPMSNAWDLAKCWPEAHLKVVEDAGHAFDEPGILHELVSAMEDFKRL
tara:strand:+ start:2492 stop:3454 length:963 start_codon:yes stop_codon:yes gene_type:complete